MPSPGTLTAGQPQFLFDDMWIADARRLVRRWLPATVWPEPVLTADRPWEGPAIVLYGSVLPRPGGGWRLYYSNFVPAFLAQQTPPSPARACTMLAESDDGLHWNKPELDIVPLPDGRPTNIVHTPGRHWDSPSLLFEPADSASPWKMIAFSTDPALGEGWNGGWGMYALGSRDGLHWTPLPPDGRRVLRAGDRSNLLGERVDGEYWLYTRHPEMGERVGGRAIYLSRSQDFLDWTEPELVLRPDLADEPDVEFYGMPVFRRHGWFIGLLEFWHSDTDTIEVHLAVSRDGRRWQRPTVRAPFIAGVHAWNRRWSSCASTGPLALGDQLLFLFGGRFTSHHYDAANLHGAIGRASLPLDRFCALEGLGHGGQFTTPAFTWPGGALLLNADTRESFASHPFHCNGELAVEVLDAGGQPLPEWSGERRALFRGNTHCRGIAQPGAVTWPGERSLAVLAGQPLRLRFHLRHARLFTFAAGGGQGVRP